MLTGRDVVVDEQLSECVSFFRAVIVGVVLPTMEGAKPLSSAAAARRIVNSKATAVHVGAAKSASQITCLPGAWFPPSHASTLPSPLPPDTSPITRPLRCLICGVCSLGACHVCQALSSACQPALAQYELLAAGIRLQDAVLEDILGTLVPAALADGVDRVLQLAAIGPLQVWLRRCRTGCLRCWPRHIAVLPVLPRLCTSDTRRFVTRSFETSSRTWERARRRSALCSQTTR